MSNPIYHRSRVSPYTTRTNSGINNQGNGYTAHRYSDGTRSYQYRNQDGGVYDKHCDGSAEYHAPSGYVRHYNPPYYSDEDRGDGGYYSSESPDSTDSEYDDRRDRGPGLGYHVPDNRGVPHVPDSESSSEGDAHDSESETETDDYSGRYVPEEYESGSAYDRDDLDSYGGSYDDWDDDDDDYGEYDGMLVLPFTFFPTFTGSFNKLDG